MRNFLLGLVVLAGCGASDAAPKAKAKVELSSVNLADDCPAPKPAQAPARAKAPANAPATPAVQAPSDEAPGAQAYRRGCDQTSMQLTLTSTGKASAKVAVKKVELLDEKGKVLGTLTARDPQTYETDTYVAWDQQLAAGATMNVMYALSAPDWDKLTKGRWNAHEKSFQLRVTVDIGSAKQKVTKTSIIPTRLQPAVPT
jgi:hypothetical protein